MTATLILSSAGGVLAFLGAIGVAVRWVARLVGATEDNTAATEQNSQMLVSMQTTVSRLVVDVEVLKDRISRGT